MLWHKRYITSYTLLLAVIVSGGLALGLSACTSPEQPAVSPEVPPSAILSPLRQLVELQPAGEEDWQEVRGTVSIGAGDSIRTSVGGVALLVFPDGTNAEIHPGTILEIEDYQPDERILVVELRLLSGQILSRVEPLSHPDARYVLHTPPATVEVQGTVYWSWVEKSEAAKFQATDGTIDLTLGGGDEVSLEAGQCLEVEADGSRGVDCSGEPAPDPLTAGGPFLRASLFGSPVDLSNCGDGICDESVAENRFNCRPDCNKASCGNSICEPNETATNCDIDCVGLGGAVCGDGTCQPGSGEDYITCQADCEPPPLFCGDGICSDRIGEDIGSCIVDCAPQGFCGDGTCSAATGENKNTCPVDCGLPGFCGDGDCDKSLDESVFTCPEDCPVSSRCGNGRCERILGEHKTCPRDCDEDDEPKTCGDGVCDPEAGEDEETCAADCGSEPPPEEGCGDGVCDPEAGEDEETCAADCGSEPPPEEGCGDGVCDPEAGEDEETCAADCGSEPPPEEGCGDGVCDPEAGEDEETCAADCGSEPPPEEGCGDGVCDPEAGEDEETCAADCGSTPPEDPPPDDPPPDDPPPDETGEPVANLVDGDIVLACVEPDVEPVCRAPARIARPYAHVTMALLSLIGVGGA